MPIQEESDQKTETSFFLLVPVSSHEQFKTVHMKYWWRTGFTILLHYKPDCDNLCTFGKELLILAAA